MRKARIASFVLLTLPGVPFVYYGEEIGMIGAKPDERIRTPMQWRPGHADGFTTGRAWEPLQPDSTTTTVEAEDRDSTSVLAMNRRMIRLRSRVPALGEGMLVPLEASVDGVAAYLREAGDQQVLVLANLTSQTLDGVALWSRRGALAPGRWALHTLLGGADGAELTVDARGQLQNFTPLPSLAPLEGFVFELRRVRGNHHGVNGP